MGVDPLVALCGDALGLLQPGSKPLWQSCKEALSLQHTHTKSAPGLLNDIRHMLVQQKPVLNTVCLPSLC